MQSMITPAKRKHYSPRPESPWKRKIAMGGAILLSLATTAAALSIILYYKGKADSRVAQIQIQKDIAPLLFHARQNTHRAQTLIRTAGTDPEEIRGLTILILNSSEKILSLDPNNEEGWRLRGQAMEYRHQFQKAAEAYSRAIQISPSSPANLLRGFLGIRELARMRLESEDSKELREKTKEDLRHFVFYSQGDISDPQNRFLASLCIAWLLQENNNVQILYRTAETIAPTEWIPPFIRALSYVDQENKKEALRAFQKAGSLAPHLSEIYAFQGKLLREIERPREALEAFQQALYSDPTSLYSRFSRAELLFSEGRYKEARRDFQKYLQNDPHSFEALLQGAICGFRAWHPEEEDAKDTLLELLEELSLAMDGEETRERALQIRALAREKAGRPEGALEDLQLLLGDSPENRTYLSQRARILTALKKWEEAIQDLTTLEDLRGRAWILSLAGRTEEALADMDRLQEKDPRDGSLYLLRAEIQLRAHQWNNALTTIIRLEEFNPHLPKATLLKAEVYLEKGEPDQTITLTTEAFEADPLFGEALILRGKAWLAKKRPDLAEKDFQAAISIDSRLRQKVPQSQTP